MNWQLPYLRSTATLGDDSSHKVSATMYHLPLCTTKYSSLSTLVIVRSWLFPQLFAPPPAVSIVCTSPSSEGCAQNDLSCSVPRRVGPLTDNNPRMLYTTSTLLFFVVFLLFKKRKRKKECVTCCPVSWPQREEESWTPETQPLSPASPFHAQNRYGRRGSRRSVMEAAGSSKRPGQGTFSAPPFFNSIDTSNIFPYVPPKSHNDSTRQEKKDHYYSHVSGKHMLKYQHWKDWVFLTGWKYISAPTRGWPRQQIHFLWPHS